jgi:tryptophan-rich sensory protein
MVGIGLLSILILTFIVFAFMFSYGKTMKAKTLYILPYSIWLCLATSLNAYILIYN